LHYASARAALLLHALLFLRSLYYTPSSACASHMHCSFFILCMTYHAMHVLRRYIHATKIHINFSYKHVLTFRLKQIFLYGKLLRVRTRGVLLPDMLLHLSISSFSDSRRVRELRQAWSVSILRRRQCFWLGSSRRVIGTGRECGYRPFISGKCSSIRRFFFLLLNNKLSWL
jgi:hypothetical protein